MPPVASFANLRVLVVGLGRFGGGVGVTRWLAGQGARVTVTDLAAEAELADSLAQIADCGVTLRLGGHDPADLGLADLVVVNPAVNKAKSAFFADIVASGVPWTTEMNLFCERCPATVVGVTGSFGKSTTCAMLAAGLEACVRAGGTPYRAVHLGGNIGRSLLGELATISSDDLVVLEMSNAQLEDLPQIDWTPHLAVLTNFTPHHLDRYDGQWEAYARAKLNIARLADPERKLVIGPVSAEVEQFVREIVPLADRRLVPVRPADPALSLALRGAHNAANGDCVWTVAGCLAMPLPPLRAAIEAFAGLPHRLQFVRRLDGVDYINDSKSTAPKATVIALDSFDDPVVAIVGAQDKGMVLDDCAQALATRCRAVVCTGQSGPKFAAAIRKSVAETLVANASPAVVREAATLEHAVAAARALARPGDVVLFSPGGPSFDGYANYERRGEHFGRVVAGLCTS
jgi:UDP-N-acetylmuramoylalanine--D-glutamate ligase